MRNNLRMINISKNKVDGEYERTDIECKKWRSFIKKIADRNITVFSKTELYVVRFEYGGIVNYSEISNGIDKIDDVWNKSDHETVPDKRRIKYNKSLLTDDDRRLMVSRNSSNKWKHNFPHHQQKSNVSLNICYEVNTKKLTNFVDNKQEPWYDSEPSAVVPENVLS